MARVEFEGEVYETDEAVFATEDGPVFLPAMEGERLFLTPGTTTEFAIRSDVNAPCLNAIEVLEIVSRANGRWAAFADLKIDDDIASDVVGVGDTAVLAVKNLLHHIKSLYPGECYCINPATDERFR